jgi:predicted NAD/FAD-binding protein
MRVAVVGAGIAGLSCAVTLADHHEVMLFERADRLGGHANTVRVSHEGREIDVDTGFIVFNDRNYPLLTRFFDRLGIEGKDAPMTFGVRDDRSGLEYGGENLNALFAQRRNLVSPRFWGMTREILRFFREAPALAELEDEDATLGEFLDAHGFKGDVVDRFLIPMGGAIWSSSTAQMREFPVKFFVRFFDNHGMLSLKDRPQWKTVPDGSRRYVDRCAAILGDRVRLGASIVSVRRERDRVVIVSERGEEVFDQVVLACHSDQALGLLADPSDAEREILGAIRYQPNDTVLHTDQSLMPRARRAWSSWIARVTADERANVVVTYDLTILQSLGTEKHLLVSLNQTGDIDPGSVLARFTYHHPVFTIESERAKGRYAEIGGAAMRTHYCGAYWFNGFHEDGVRSAARVCGDLGVTM